MKKNIVKKYVKKMRREKTIHVTKAMYQLIVADKGVECGASQERLKRAPCNSCQCNTLLPPPPPIMPPPMPPASGGRVGPLSMT